MERELHHRTESSSAIMRLLLQSVIVTNAYIPKCLQTQNYLKGSQVWEQLGVPQVELESLCREAGLDFPAGSQTQTQTNSRKCLLFNNRSLNMCCLKANTVKIFKDICRRVK